MGYVKYKSLHQTGSAKGTILRRAVMCYPPFAWNYHMREYAIIYPLMYYNILYNNMLDERLYEQQTKLHIYICIYTLCATYSILLSFPAISSFFQVFLYSNMQPCTCLISGLNQSIRGRGLQLSWLSKAEASLVIPSPKYEVPPPPLPPPTSPLYTPPL